MRTPEEIEKALAIANKIGEAVMKKFPKHSLFVRRNQTGDSGYIEIALRPDGGGFNQEITTSYADEFYIAASQSHDVLKDKAQRVLADFRVQFGIK